MRPNLPNPLPSRILASLGWIGLILYWILIFYLTHRPTGGTFGVQDKIAHFGAYGVLATLLFLVTLAGRSSIMRTALFVLVCCASYGIADELLQMLVPPRTADFKDWVADVLGASTAVAVCSLATWLYGLRRSESSSRTAAY